MERDFLKIILHKIYEKVVLKRSMIRRSINDCLYDMIHTDPKFNGAHELLNILCSIISGFTRPLKEEHKMFFN